MLLAEDMAERIEMERRIARDMEIAKQVQARLFPQELPLLGTLEYAGRCIQAREVGGDDYDLLNLDAGSIGIVLADIVGKGIPGALLMANVQADVRSPCDSSSPRIEINTACRTTTAAVSRTTSTADRNGPSLCTSPARACLTQCMSAASPADCSQSVIITIRTAIPISRIKAIAQEQSSVNGDLAAFARFVFG